MSKFFSNSKKNKVKVLVKDVEDSQKIKCGYLSKRGPKRNSRYNVRYWILTPTTLYYFNSGSSNESCKGAIELKFCKVHPDEKGNEFTITHATSEKSREYYIKSDSFDDKNAWIEIIKQTISSLQNEGSQPNTGQSMDSYRSFNDSSNSGFNNNPSQFSSPPSSDFTSNTFQQNSPLNDPSRRTRPHSVFIDTTRRVIKVYLADLSSKTIAIDTDTVQDVIIKMEKKMGGDSYRGFRLFEIRDHLTILLNLNDRLSDIIDLWPHDSDDTTHRIVFQPEDAERLKEASKIGQLQVRTNANRYSSRALDNVSKGFLQKFTLRKKKNKPDMVKLSDLKVFQKSGYIHRKGGPKYCILQQNNLYYFDDDKPQTMSSGKIPLSTTTIYTGKSLMFTMYYTCDTTNKEFEAQCKSNDEKQIWLDLLIPLSAGVTDTPKQVTNNSSSSSSNSSNKEVDQSLKKVVEDLDKQQLVHLTANRVTSTQPNRRPPTNLRNKPKYNGGQSRIQSSGPSSSMFSNQSSNYNSSTSLYIKSEMHENPSMVGSSSLEDIRSSNDTEEKTTQFSPLNNSTQQQTTSYTQQQTSYTQPQTTSYTQQQTSSYTQQQTTSQQPFNQDQQSTHLLTQPSSNYNRPPQPQSNQPLNLSRPPQPPPKQPPKQPLNPNTSQNMNQTNEQPLRQSLPPKGPPPVAPKTSPLIQRVNSSNQIETKTNSQMVHSNSQGSLIPNQTQMTSNQPSTPTTPYGSNQHSTTTTTPYGSNQQSTTTTPYGSNQQSTTTPYGSNQQSTTTTTTPYGSNQQSTTTTNPYGSNQQSTTTTTPYGSNQQSTTTPYGSNQQSTTTTTTPYGSNQQSTTTPYGSNQQSTTTTTTPYGSNQQSTTTTPYGSNQQSTTTTTTSYGSNQQSTTTTTTPYGSNQTTSLYGTNQSQPVVNTPSNSSTPFNNSTPSNTSTPQSTTTSQPQTPSNPISFDSPSLNILDIIGMDSPFDDSEDIFSPPPPPPEETEINFNFIDLESTLNISQLKNQPTNTILNDFDFGDNGQKITMTQQTSETKKDPNEFEIIDLADILS